MAKTTNSQPAPAVDTDSELSTPLARLKEYEPVYSSAIKYNHNGQRVAYPDGYVTKTELADCTGWSATTITNYCKDGAASIDVKRLPALGGKRELDFVHLAQFIAHVEASDGGSASGAVYYQTSIKLTNEQATALNALIQGQAAFADVELITRAEHSARVEARAKGGKELSQEEVQELES